jgi:hypothetical protein
MDEIHALRDQYGADLVGLWVGTASNCGRGYIMTNVDVAFEDRAFTVTKRICAWFWAFAHELGHNMGSRHDWYVDDSTTPYPYAHGYIYEQTPNLCLRTIMAYDDFCSDRGLLTIPVPLFANPEKNLFGHPLGIDEIDPEPADVRKTLNNTAYTVANFRQSVCDCAIGAECYQDGNANPDNPCEICDSLQSPAAWSLNDDGVCPEDGLFCNGIESCMNGACQSPGDPCSENEICNEEIDTCDDLTDDDDDDDNANDDDNDDNSPDNDDDDEDEAVDLSNDMRVLEDDEGCCG